MLEAINMLLLTEQRRFIASNAKHIRRLTTYERADQDVAQSKLFLDTLRGRDRSGRERN